MSKLLVAADHVGQPVAVASVAQVGPIAIVDFDGISAFSVGWPRFEIQATSFLTFNQFAFRVLPRLPEPMQFAGQQLCYLRIVSNSAHRG